MFRILRAGKGKERATSGRKEEKWRERRGES